MSSFVLVHGGCHAGWCWERVLGPLRAAGHDARAVDLPGRAGDDPRAADLAGYVRTVVEAIDAAGEPVVLVAHSMGGVTCGQVAEERTDDIATLIYVSAVVPGAGEAGFPCFQTAGPESVLLQEGGIVFSADGALATIPAQAARAAFYEGCADEDAAWAIERLEPEPVAPLMEPLRLGSGFACVDKHYIGATEDRAVPPEAQRRWAERAGASFTAIESDHSPFLSAVDPLVAMLLDEAAR